MEGGQGHQGGHHRGDRCQGQVRSPVDHPARTWEVLSNFVLLPIFFETIVVVVVVVVVAVVEAVIVVIAVVVATVFIVFVAVAVVVFFSFYFGVFFVVFVVFHPRRCFAFAVWFQMAEINPKTQVSKGFAQRQPKKKPEKRNRQKVLKRERKGKKRNEKLPGCLGQPGTAGGQF